MKSSNLALLALANTAAALTQQCSAPAVNDGGNYYCGAVGHILYQGVGGNGSYQAVQAMSATGDCPKATKDYGGVFAPLDEDLSFHFRGPIHVKEFAVYNLSKDNKKKRELAKADEAKADEARADHPRGHRHLHGAARSRKKRAEWVTATINGDVVSWEKVYYGPKTEAPPAPAAASTQVPAAATAAVHDDAQLGAGSSSSSSAPAPASTSGPAAASGKDWDRIAYYNAETQQADNVVFLANYGGQGSGRFDTVWGNSLSFVNAEGTGGASSPQVLADVEIPSNKEFAIFSGERCDGSCGFSRSEDVAYKGFAGTHKVFLFRFRMPLDGRRGFNGDMPAVWALNARIPRTAQYGACSCWASRCGELDAFEVLAPGDARCKSTLHLARGGGSSDYFPRPVARFARAAVVFDEDAGGVAITLLDDDDDGDDGEDGAAGFPAGLDDDVVHGWVTGRRAASASASASPASAGIVQKLGSSLFQIADGLSV